MRNTRNKEVGRYVPLVTKVRPRNKMILGIMGVMEVDVVAKQLAANRMVVNFIT